MAFSYSCAASSVNVPIRVPYLKEKSIIKKKKSVLFSNIGISCCQQSEEETTGKLSSRGVVVVLEIGSPIIVTEAPKMIKTAASIPCLRVNSGLVKPGDVGRIVSRKPKDVWAVRLAIGTFLIDGKYFKPLELDD